MLDTTPHHLRLPSKDARCETLDLKVIDNNIIWELKTSDISGTGRTIRNGKAELSFADARESIELLQDLLHLLLDVSPRDAEQAELVGGTLVQLASRLGDELYQVLFADRELEKVLNESVNKSTSGEIDLLRIELEFSGKHGNLGSWPWEYLRTPGLTGNFLTLSARLVLNRRLSFQRKDFPTAKPVLLLVVSRPRDHGAVTGDSVIEKLRALQSEDKIVLHELIEPQPSEFLDKSYRPTASFDRFTDQIIKYKPHIVHFIGHGRLSYDRGRKCNIGELGFVGAGGQIDWQSESEFVAALIKENPNLRLVFLQACESALSDPRAHISGVAMLLARNNIPAVIAMQAKIQNGIANSFAAAFYDMIGDGAPTDWAAKVGRAAISSMKLPQSQLLAFGLPVVYLTDYRGLIDRQSTMESGTTTTRTVVVPPNPPEESRGLLIEVCPNCHRRLVQTAREKSRCTRCGLLMRCPDKLCSAPLDDPDPDGGFCGSCGARIPAMDSGGPMQAERLAVSPVVAPAAKTEPDEAAALIRTLAERFPQGAGR